MSPRSGGQLTVAGLALERDGKGLAVDEHVAGDDARSDALSEDVEEGGLAGAGLSHEAGHLARLHEATDVVE